MPSITIDRDTRNVLHCELEGEISGAGETLMLCDGAVNWPKKHISRDRAESAVALARWAIDLLDELGWDDDDLRQYFELPVDGSFTQWLRRRREAMTEQIEPGTYWADALPLLTRLLERVDERIGAVA